jgi:hypothetical protein
MSQVLLSNSPIPGCDSLFQTSNSLVLPRVPRHVKRMAPSEVASLDSQYRAYKLRCAEYECASSIRDFESRVHETVTEPLIPPPDPPPFALPAAQSMLSYYKSKNTFNPVAPIKPTQFRPPHHSVPFRVSSILPAHLTIPVVSPSLKLNHERAQQRLAAMMTRLDALESQRKREIARSVRHSQKLQFIENRSRRGVSEMFGLAKVRQEAPAPEEDPGEEVRQLMAELDERHRKMKEERHRQRAEAIWSGEPSAPFVPGDCTV